MDRDAAHVAWVKGLVEQLAPWTQGYYINFAKYERASDTEDSFPAGNWARVVAAKSAYDPQVMCRCGAVAGSLCRWLSGWNACRTCCASSTFSTVDLEALEVLMQRRRRLAASKQSVECLPACCCSAHALHRATSWRSACCSGQV